jgi:peptidoglycan hydrolase-like amidase
MHRGLFRFHFAALMAGSLILISACGGRGVLGLSEPDPEPVIRVRIVHSVPEITINPPAGSRLDLQSAEGVVVPLAEGEWIIRARDGVAEARAVDGTKRILAQRMRLIGTAETEEILVRDVPVGVGWWWETRKDRTYEGLMEFSAKEDGTLDVVLELPVEEYLRGVVPAEIGATSPMEALKAQAVAARSETMTALSEGTYAGPGFDICADVDCQVFAGTGGRSEATDQAIRETRGVILSYDGKPIPAYYASNCGGHSEDVANVWPSRERGIPTWRAYPDGPGGEGVDLTAEDAARAWVTGRPEAYCNGDTHPGIPQWAKNNFRWEVETSAEDLSLLVEKKSPIGRVLRIEAVERGPSGRLTRVRFVGEKGEHEVGPELAIRQVWQPPLKSSAFVVDPVGDTARPDAFRIRGAGYGHGVGMCQTGAMARAMEGQDYRQILSHYYREASIKAVYR